VHDLGKEKDRNDGGPIEKVRGLKKTKIGGKRNLNVRTEEPLWKIEETPL
jgi:hypothetical protein